MRDSVDGTGEDGEEGEVMRAMAVVG